MLLPYASDHALRRRPVVTWTLLAFLFATTTITQASDHWQGVVTSAWVDTTFGIVPAHFRPWTLFTYTFFHEGFAHLLTNAFYLWLFGAGVEDALGRKRFLLLYLAGGAVGGALQTLVTLTLAPPSAAIIPIVGASGACAALIGLYAVLYYRARLTFVGLPFRPHVVAVVSVFLLLEVFQGMWALALGSVEGEVAHWAHVGGFIFGLVGAQILGLERIGASAYLASDASLAMDNSVPGAAIRRWEKLLAREPENSTARIEIARAWLLLGDREQAASNYLQAVRLHLANNRRVEAAVTYEEMRESIGREPLKGAGKDAATSAPDDADAPPLTPGELFAVGLALEDIERFTLASEALRMVTVRNPDGAEAETAMLKVISLYVHRLDRREEARILVRLFFERYPHSQWKRLAEDLQRAASQE